MMTSKYPNCSNKYHMCCDTVGAIATGSDKGCYKIIETKPALLADKKSFKNDENTFLKGWSHQDLVLLENPMNRRCWY